MVIMRQTSHNRRRGDYPKLTYGNLTEILPIFTGKRLERFHAKIDRSAGRLACHRWLGSATSGGYGLVQGSIRYQGYSFLAHRVAWTLAHEMEPGELDILHRCDNPACCNPRHLYRGTAQDNTMDMVLRGRANFRGAHGRAGADANRATFTWAQRAEAHRLRYEERLPLDAIAARIGCHRATISRWLGPA